MFTSAPHALRRGLSIDKQNCRQNSVLIYGTGAFNVKSNSFKVNWSLTACLDVLFKASGGSGSRRMDAGLQTGQSVHTKGTIQAHVLQRCKEQKYTHKNNIIRFFSVVAHYATDWNFESIHRAEPWLQVKAAKKKKTKKQKSKMVSDPCRVMLNFCWTVPITAHV